MTFVVTRVIALTMVLFVCFAVAAAAVGLGGSQTSESASSATLLLLLVCLLQVCVLTYLILRSRWSGWRLAATIFFVFYGVATFMPQIESAVFLTRLPPGMVPRLFLFGALTAAPFSILAVLILGKSKPQSADTESDSPLRLTAGEWTGKLIVIAAAYLILYFTFGYFVAWRNPAVREYYGGIDPGSFFGQMRQVLHSTPWLFPLQIARAMCWVALALPVIRMMKGEWQEIALAIGLLFAVVMNAQLLLPNPYMPEPVRMAHLAETVSSNFIFGALIGWLFSESRTHSALPLVQAAG
ncbi:MAG: hypothetical protein ACREMS_05980 [Gemmatimonadaceae bacterium]